jgi:hypothetical protein
MQPELHDKPGADRRVPQLVLQKGYLHFSLRSYHTSNRSTLAGSLTRVFGIKYDVLLSACRFGPKRRRIFLGTVEVAMKKPSLAAAQFVIGYLCLCTGKYYLFGGEVESFSRRVDLSLGLVEERPGLYEKLLKLSENLPASPIDADFDKSNDITGLVDLLTHAKDDQVVAKAMIENVHIATEIPAIYQMTVWGKFKPGFLNGLVKYLWRHAEKLYIDGDVAATGFARAAVVLSARCELTAGWLFLYGPAVEAGKGELEVRRAAKETVMDPTIPFLCFSDLLQLDESKRRQLEMLYRVKRGYLIDENDFNLFVLKSAYDLLLGVNPPEEHWLRAENAVRQSFKFNTGDTIREVEFIQIAWRLYWLARSKKHEKTIKSMETLLESLGKKEESKLYKKLGEEALERAPDQEKFILRQNQEMMERLRKK